MTDNRVAPRADLRRHAGGKTLTMNDVSTMGDCTLGLGTAGLGTPELGTPELGTLGLGTLGRSITRPLVTAFCMAGLLLAGCSPNPAPAGSRLRVYAADLRGAAKVCDVPNVNPVAGGKAEAAMKVVNDGGWCGIRVHQDGPKPFEAGLLAARPDHGSVLIHEVGDDTRIDYTPDRGFSGNDAFSIRLIPGNASVHVTVAVTVAPKTS